MPVDRMTPPAASPAQSVPAPAPVPDEARASPAMRQYFHFKRKHELITNLLEREYINGNRVWAPPREFTFTTRLQF